MRYRTVAARIDWLLWERLIERVPEDLKRPFVASIHEAGPSNEASRTLFRTKITVPGAEMYRGDHLHFA